MSEYLVGSAAFNAVGAGDPCPAGSIPVHLRYALGEGASPLPRTPSLAATAARRLSGWRSQPSGAQANNRRCRR